MKNLPDVTLLVISSIRIPGMIRALEICMKDFNFGAVKLLSHEKPENLPEEIQFELCPKISNTYDFDVYSFLHLWKHLDTTHMLMVQDHAYILRPELWNDQWLEYDYIGAPWPVRNNFISPDGEMVRVGNGGFSLRSKYLMRIPERLNLPVVNDRGYTNDDGLINVYYRKIFKKQLVNYAPVEVAAVFSHENDIPENFGVKTFGFHRYES